MNPILVVYVYLVLWWTTFLIILPIGVQSHWEAGTPTPGGGDPAAPVDPKLVRKCLTTTWVAAVEVAIVWFVVSFHLIHLPQLGG